MHVSQALCRALDKCDLLRLVARNGRATPHQSLFQLFQNQNASTKKKGAELASGRRQTRCTTRQSAHAQIEILSPENLLPKHSTKQISCLKKNSRQKASKGQFYRQSLLLLAHSFHFLHEYHAIHCKVESNAPVNFNG